MGTRAAPLRGTIIIWAFGTYGIAGYARIAIGYVPISATRLPWRHFATTGGYHTERNIEHRVVPAEGIPRSGLWSLAFGEVRVATDAIGTQKTFIHMPHSGVAPSDGGCRMTDRGLCQ